MKDEPQATDVLQALETLLIERKNTYPSVSYIASMYAKGQEHLVRKLMEEALELTLASCRAQSDVPAETKAKVRTNLVHEGADVLFHWLLLLTYHDIPLHEVLSEIRAR